MRQSAKRGESNITSKLTNSDILKIRELHKLGISQRKIAIQFNIVKSNVASIVNRITWKHI